jgi:uncharacterized protein
MLIRVRDIGESPEELTYDEPTTELNSLLNDEGVCDFQFRGPAAVRLSHYCAGRDLFFSGEVVSSVVGQCARCLESFDFDTNAAFDVVFVPRAGELAEYAEEAGEADVAPYDGEEIDLSPILQEHMLIALPTMPLCDEACRGLCARCGANINLDECDCDHNAGDSRLAVLRGLKVDR